MSTRVPLFYLLVTEETPPQALNEIVEAHTHVKIRERANGRYLVILYDLGIRYQRIVCRLAERQRLAGNTEDVPIYHTHYSNLIIRTGISGHKDPAMRNDQVKSIEPTDTKDEK